MRWYILKNGKPTLEKNILTASQWFVDQYEERRIALDIIDDVTISTVFLGLDHGWNDKGLPVLWETMIFGGILKDTQERATSKKRALENHKRLLDDVYKSKKD